jgi:glycosyltransferase A (GT-A) superfamily protein (DUF2064 family)
MFKAPMRSKRRLHAEIGEAAQTVSELFLACAVEDAASWPGPVCFAAASRHDAAWLRRHHEIQGDVIEQGGGNLGERIEFVNDHLFDKGHMKQIFIGSDCPALDGPYLDAADRALANHDVVLGPAADGGVVLMGVAGRWPPLAELPWSTAALSKALIALCEGNGRTVALLDARADVDAAADLDALGPALAEDARPARRALLRWLQSAGGSAQ